MVWSTKSKSLDITSTTSHRSSAPKVVGRALSTSSLDITPTELFGAAARSSHLHSINIAIATPESVVMARLIEQYIDNTSSNFAIMSNVDSLKDYVKSYFVGTVAAGLAYMTMINEGYVWSDHFENVGGGNPKTKRKPDYVFAGPATGLALMEAKGARSGNIHTFDGRVLDGYSGQVEPHLGHQVGGQTAVRGYSIGAWMQSTTQTELRLHHTAPPAAPQTQAPSPSTATSSSVGVATSIQRSNFATAFALAHSPMLANSIRREGELTLEDEVVPFLRFRWLGHYWLSSPQLPISSWRGTANYWRVLRAIPFRGWINPFYRPQTFAIREDIGRLALRSFLDDRADADREVIPFKVVDDDLREQARTYEREGVGGAVFPDGLALIASGAKIDELGLLLWRRATSDFEPI